MIELYSEMSLSLSAVTVHHVVCVHTYQEGQVRKPVVLGEKVNRLLFVELILHLQM